MNNKLNKDSIKKAIAHVEAPNDDYYDCLAADQSIKIKFLRKELKELQAKYTLLNVMSWVMIVTLVYLTYTLFIY
jgi:hypothetical protein